MRKMILFTLPVICIALMLVAAPALAAPGELNAADIPAESPLPDSSDNPAARDNSMPAESDKPAEPANPSTPEKPSSQPNTPDNNDSQEPDISVAVTYMDGDTELHSETVVSGSAPSEIPKLDGNGAAVAAWVIDGVRVEDASGVTVSADSVWYVWHAPALETVYHPTYIRGTGDGAFSPNAPLSRSQAAVMLANLLTDDSPGLCTSAFTDLADGTWYASAVKLLASHGIIQGYTDTTVNPDGGVTRAELVAMLSRIYPGDEISESFSDVSEEHWAYKYVATAAARGWTNGYPDGTFRPDNGVTRAEAVKIINSALGRAADTAVLEENNMRSFRDVFETDWYYPYIAEASTAHEPVMYSGREQWMSYLYTDSGCGTGMREIDGYMYYLDENSQFVTLAPGVQSIDGKSWYVDENRCIPVYGEGTRDIGGKMMYINSDGSILTDGDIGYLHFGTDGAYTTGNEELDKLVEDVIASWTKSEDPPETRLRAAYLYLRDHFTYLARPHHGRGTTYWTEESAVWMFKNRRGNCYCFAASFMYIARRLGYQAYSVSGGVGSDNSDHAWVMIEWPDGNSYMFDPELEYAYLYKYADKYEYNLYKMRRYYDTPFSYFFP